MTPVKKRPSSKSIGEASGDVASDDDGDAEESAADEILRSDDGGGKEVVDEVPGSDDDDDDGGPPMVSWRPESLSPDWQPAWSAVGEKNSDAI